ncbi:hypothetical protein BGZ83_000540 [Gryganskiella cystojenkinii]|nr:hypothetical protein BGZ83_000540 [Gryganskiella cystojenkinii]
MEGPRSRPPNADLFLRHLASLDQHDQQQQQQPSSQYRYDISEDPESGEDRNEYAEDEQGRVLEQEQMGGLHEQDYRQEEGVLEGEEEEVREEDGTAASNLSADILLDASKSYRKRYLSRAAAAASRRLPQEDEEDLPEETEEEEDPFNPVGSSSNSSLPSHRGHKRARLMMMMSGDEGSFHNSSFDDSFGQENHHDLQHTLPDQQQQQQQQLVDESEDSSLQVTVADSDVDGGHVSEQDDEGENELYEIYDPPSEAQLQETDAEEEEQDSQHQFGQQYHVLPPHAQTPGQPQYYQSTPGLTDNEEEHEDEIEVEETEVNVEEDEDDDEDENQRIEEEKMQQLVEASETESAETMAELCDFEAPGSILQGPALRQRLINEPEDQQAGRHENWEHQVVDEEIWWDLDPRALDAPHERLL